MGLIELVDSLPAMPTTASSAAAAGRFVRERSRKMMMDTRARAQPRRATSRMSMILLGNDSWELFEGIPRHYPLRTRVRIKLRYSNVGLAWEVFQTLFALVASVLYVMQTYEPGLRTTTFDIVSLVVFSADYALNLFCCENRLAYVFSFTAIVDAITIVPAVLDYLLPSGDSPRATFPFLRFIRVLRLLRLIRLVRVAGTRSISAVQKQIHAILLLTTCIGFIAAGVFHAVEAANRPPELPPITFGDALYFLLVTMTTVGYGDIAPMTSLGKLVAAAVIVVSFTVIPTELARLNQLMALQSQFRKFYRPIVGNPHILVVGHVTDPRSLLDFFRELYHPDRMLSGGGAAAASGGSGGGVSGACDEANPLRDPPCVLMGPGEPSEEVVALLDHPIVQNRVTYIKGSVLSEEDLCRVGADSARACFVLAAKATDDPKHADAETVLRLLAIRNYNPELEIYTQIVSPTYSAYISEVDADHVLCLDQLKLSLMAKSCLCPGLVTLISNMFRSSSIGPKGSGDHPMLAWEKEYVEGLALEVYATRLPAAFFGLTFAQACEVLYRCTHGEVILMATFEPRPHRHAHDHDGSTRGGRPQEPHGLPTLKVQAMAPSASWEADSDSGSRAAASSSRMFVNPGATLLMAPGQIVYVLSESKSITLTASIAQHLADWLGAGHTLPMPSLVPHPPPPPPPSSSSACSAPSSSQSPHASSPTSTSPRAKLTAPRSPADVLVEDARDPRTGAAIEHHILVVTDLNDTAMQALIRVLRAPHLAPGHRDYHPVLFLSWSVHQSPAAACRLLAAYADVYLMMAQGDSKLAFLRANILRASRCVLLSDKRAIAQLDGEQIDSLTIFHYLAILSIQSEFGMDTTSGLMPIVDLTVPRTMKILDTALRKRTMRSYIHRQKMEAQLYANALAAASSSASSDRPRRPKGRWRRDLVDRIVHKSTENLSSLESSLRQRQRQSARHTSLRRQEDDRARRTGTFDSGGSSMLPFFAAGYGFSDDVFDNMLCQSFFTPGLIRFINALLFSENGQTSPRLAGAPVSLNVEGAGEVFELGVEHHDDGDVGDDDDDGDEPEEDPGEPVVVSSLVQIPVLEDFVGRPFGELFVHLAAREHVVAIGLFRGSGTPFSLPYVATGPASDAVLMKDDLVYVLAQPHALRRLAAAASTPTSPSGKLPKLMATLGLVMERTRSPPTTTPGPSSLSATKPTAGDGGGVLPRTIAELVLQTK